MSNMNRSVARTREALRNAFAKLALENGAEKIAVVDVTKYAGLSRGTFYVHYEDISALKKDVKAHFEETFDQCLNETDADTLKNTPASVLQEFSKFISESEETCKLVLQTPYCSYFFEKMKQVFTKSVLLDLKRNGVDAPLLPYLLAGGMAELYTKYLEGELQCTLLQINEKLMSLYAEKCKKLKG